MSLRTIIFTFLSSIKDRSIFEFEGIDIYVNDGHSAKVFSLIEVVEDKIVTCVNVEHPEKA